jgi:hypothetical protein
MFSLNKLFGGAKEPAGPTPRRTKEGPFGLSLGRAVTFDLIRLKIAGDALAMGVPPERMVISGHGSVDLGGGSLLHRFYDDNDRMLQVVCNGSVDEVQEVMLLQPWDNVVPATQGEWLAWLGPNGKMGQAKYNADGIIFDRVWGDPNTPWIPAVEFVEDIVVDEGADKSIHQSSMAYKRILPGDVTENLIIIAERNLALSDPGDIAFMVGYSLSPADVTPV